MAKSQEEIFDSIRDILVDALGVDESDVTPEACLTKDLGAESIDFLDINFKIEKKFSTPEKPFKVLQGELFPENLASDASLVKDGKFTDAGMDLLRSKMPHVDLSAFNQNRSVDAMSELFTVQSLVAFVSRKLAA